MFWEPDPVLLSAGSLQLRVLSAYLVLAFAFAFALFRRRTLEEGRSRADSSEFLSVAILVVVGTSRVVALLAREWSAFLEAPRILFLSGRFSTEGAAVGVLVVGLLFAHEKREDWRRVLDWIAPGAVGAAVICSVGQWFALQQVGRPSRVAWAMRFPGFDAADVEAPLRHPLQIYELLGGAGIVLILWAAYRMGVGERSGRIAGFAALSYFAFRISLSPVQEVAERLSGLELSLAALFVSLGVWLFVSAEPR